MLLCRVQSIENNVHHLIICQISKNQKQATGLIKKTGNEYLLLQTGENNLIKMADHLLKMSNKSLCRQWNGNWYGAVL